MSIADVDEDFLQILDESGQALGSETSVKIQALYKEDEGSRYELLISNRACVRLPKKTGTLLVTLPATRKALVHRHEQGGRGQLVRKNLVNAPSIQSAFPCGEGGLFANQSVVHNWIFESSDNLQSMKLEILAKDPQSKTSFPLFVKDFGAPTVNLQSTLDTSLLKEGIYQLEANTYDLLDGLGEVSRPLIKTASCPLTILRRPPLVGGSLDQNTLPVLAPGTALSWTIEKPNSQLYACFEERSGFGTPNLTAPTSCEAQAKCRNVESFKPVDAISSDKVGLFDVYAFARDRAGNDSPLRCQTVAFSSAPPALTLKWERESWNQDGAFMRELDAFIKAKASIGSHDVLAEETLKQTLECKVEFILQGKDTLSGKDVICTQGRCRGKSLSNFTPCDPEIEFTLQEAWQQPAIQQSMMRLVVRAQDGAGHVSEVARSIGINNRNWDIQRLDYLEDGKPIDASKLIQDASGQFLAAFEVGNSAGSVRKWDGTAWVNVTPDLPGAYLNTSFFMTPRQELYAIFYRWTSDFERFSVLAQWDGKKWDLIQAPDNTAKGCLTLNIAESGFYCRAPDNIYHFDGKKWGGPIPLPSEQFQTEYCDLGKTLDAQGLIWQVCGNELFVWRSGPQWQRVSGYLQGIRFSVTSIFSDVNDRVWVFAYSLRESFFGYFDEMDSYQPISLPKEKNGHLVPCTPVLAHDERVVCERYFWNSTNRDWQLLPEFSRFDYKAFARLNPGNGGTEAFAPIKNLGSPVKLWVAPTDGFYVASGSRLDLWPSAFTQAYLHNSSSIYQDKDGSFWFNASAGRNGRSIVHRIKTQPVVSYDQNFLGLSHGMLPFPWEDAAGSLKMAFFDHGIFAFKEGRWQQESPGLPTGAEHQVNFESSDGTLYSATYNEVWMRPRNSSTFTRLNSEPLQFLVAQGGFVETEDGAVWILTTGYAAQLLRVVNGKMDIYNIPADVPDVASGILDYRGRIVVVTNSAFYWADPDAEGRVVFSRFDPQTIGLKGLPKSQYIALLKLSRHRYRFSFLLEDNSSPNYVLDTLAGTFEPLALPYTDFSHLTANDAGDMFAQVGDGRIIKKSSQSNNWVTVITPDQLKAYGSKNSYLCWMKVDKLGRLWIHTGGPWLIARLDE